MTNTKKYDYIIIGAGIAGCSVAFHLSKTSKNILLVDRNSNVGVGASGAAGAFLSPLLGKNNALKVLVSKALKYSVEFYKDNIGEYITNDGIIRIPKDEIDDKKFQGYIPYLDFKYEEIDGGYFFDIGSKVNSTKACEILAQDVEKKFNTEVETIEYKNGTWILNDEIQTLNLILTTGADIFLINHEDYFNIRPVWGQKIDIETSTQVKYNYHKSCSISSSQKISNDKHLVTIGATHNIYNCDHKVCSYCLKIPNISDKPRFTCDNDSIQEDTNKLLESSKQIMELKDIKVLNTKIGARASSIDYLPMVGELINSEQTLLEYPYIKKGSKVPPKDFVRYNNLYVLNGVGGRGFVLSPYLAKLLVDSIVSDKNIDENITTNRLFQRWARRL